MNSRSALTFVLMAALTGCGFRTGLDIGFDSGAEQADASSTTDGGEIDASEDDGGVDFDGGDAGFEDDWGVPFDFGQPIDFGRDMPLLGWPENTFETCTDEIDNDGDGFVDCEDFDCRGVVMCDPLRDSGVPFDASRPDASTPTDGGVINDASRPDAGRDASTPTDSGVIADASRPDAGRDASTPDAGRDASTPTDSGVINDSSTPADAAVPRDSGFTFPDSGIPGPTPCMTSSECSPVGPVAQVCWTEFGYCAPRCDALPGGAFSICSLLGNGSVCDAETGACVIP